MEIVFDKGYYKIYFGYRPHIVAAVKSLPSRSFNPAEKCWCVPAAARDEVLDFAKKYRFRLIDATVDEPEIIGEIPPMPELEVEVQTALELYPYQKQGVAYCLNHPRTIIGDVPGLGKTAQSIASVIAHRAYPCLIICPASLKINWSREVKLWGGKEVNAMIINDKNKDSWHLTQSGFFTENVQFFIVNYESLKKYFVDSINTPKGKKFMLSHIKFNERINLFRSVIIDESHKCKNGSTQQSKYCMGIAKDKEVVLLLTGTPVVNKPKDLVPQLHIMNMLPRFGGYKRFMDRYCSGRNQSSHLKELNYLLSINCFYQRRKEDVLQDLPSKTRQTVLCDISNRFEYSVAENDLIKYLREYRDATADQQRKAMRGEVIVRINVLRQICARGKVRDIQSFIDTMMEQGQKLILFMNLIELGDAFKSIYPNAVVIRGGMSVEDKQVSVDKFQTDPDCKLVICNIKAAGVGLTLTASSHVAFVEFPWTFADCVQCEDRAHRIGQKDNVTCHYFLGSNTIDEKIYQLIQEKKNLAEEITGNIDEVEENVVDSLVNLFS